MLPKPYRLKGKKTFNALLKSRYKIGSDYLSLKWIICRDNALHVGIVAPLSVSKKATARNRVKRLLREVMRREFLSALHGKIDILIMARPRIRELDYWGIKEEIGRLFQRAGIIDRR